MIPPPAIIEKGAELGSGVQVGAFGYIGPEVRIGDNCEIRNHASIVGNTTVGKECLFFPYCVIGEMPQDLKYQGEATKTIIGDDNHFREFVTVHSGTKLGGGVTRIGSHSRFLVGVHLAHDAHIGNHVVASNQVQIAGHVRIEDCVTMGGHSGAHQFVTIGQYAMIGGLSPVTSDAPPYVITSGHPAEVRSLNTHALKRWNIPTGDIEDLSKAYRLLYSKRGSENGTFAERLERLIKENSHQEHVFYLCRFLKRTITEGKSGRYLESYRRDKPSDSQAFFTKKQALDTPAAVEDTTSDISSGDR